MTGLTRFDAVSVPTGARVVDDPDELDAFFDDRRGAHVYALADLDEEFWAVSRWFRRGDAVVGAVGMPGDEATAAYAVSTRAAAATLALMTELAPALPAGLVVSGGVGAVDALRPVRTLAWGSSHVRYELVDRAAVPAWDPAVVPLGLDDLAELEALYASEPGAAFFRPHMLAKASFVGVRDGGVLVAAAGTHVLSERRGAAAVGAVFTRPSHRGRGLGRAVTAGVIDRIGGRIDAIGLNVAVDNAPARRIYESIGFVEVIAYEEAELA